MERRPPLFTAHLVTLKRVGLVLILVGAADILFMAYSLAQGRSYSSSLNIFALIAGILVYRGGLGAARVVAHSAAFMLAGMAGAILFLPLIVPGSLVLISARLYPVAWLLTVVVAVALMGTLVWVRGQLTGGPVAAAFERSGKEPPRTTVPLALGAILSLVVVLVLQATFGGQAAQEAMGRARQQLGSDYRFLVTNMSLSYNQAGRQGRAVVLAYRPGEVRHVFVRLDSPPAESAPAPEPAPSGSEGTVSAEVSGVPVTAVPVADVSVDAMPVTDAESYARRAAAYGRAGDFEKALADADTAMAMDPDRIETYVLADWILQHQGRWDEIIARWTRFIDTHPSNGRAFFERSGAHHHKGADDAARRDVEQGCALQHEPACQLARRLGFATAHP